MHYSVYVIHDNDTSVGDLLSPYDENLQTGKKSILYTKQEIIDKFRLDTDSYEKTIYADYLKDTEAYEKKWGENKEHLKYLKEEFPKILKFNDEECWAEATKYYETDDEGNVLTDGNPNAKWDWCEIGGRWSGNIPDNETTLEKLDVENVEIPYVVVTPSGEWVSKEDAEWFGESANGIEDVDKEWESKVSAYLKDLKSKDNNLILTQVDCHM